jgi:hypothetical protein
MIDRTVVEELAERPRIIHTILLKHHLIGDERDT